jgi:hypothetical protein
VEAEQILLNYTAGNIDANDKLTMKELATLPTPRFELPKWAGFNFGDGVRAPNHSIRVLNFDFDNSGSKSLLVISRPNLTGGIWPKFSEVQFLKNNGGGNFTDVTDSTLINYNTNTAASYTPKLVDLNGDGLTDILLSGTDYSGRNNSSQVLIHTKEHKYVASFQTIISDYNAQVTAIQKSANMGNTVTILKSPDNKLYLVTTVNYSEGGVLKQSVYLSALGDVASGGAQATVNNIKQTWPWMSDAQVNTLLSQSNSGMWLNTPIVDINKVMQPIGPLTLGPISRPIQGFIFGVNMPIKEAHAFDSTGRNFTVNLGSMAKYGTNAFGANMGQMDSYEITSHAERFLNANAITINGMRIGADVQNPYRLPGSDQVRNEFGNTGSGVNASDMINYGGARPQQFTVGVPNYYRNGKWSMGTQYTSLNSSPWLNFGGSWGSINNSGTLEHVVSYKHQGFSWQGSLTRTTHTVSPGLVTKVNDITGAWTEAGWRGNHYRYGDLGVYAGIKPYAFSGSVEANIPQGVDTQGNPVYNKHVMSLQNQVTPYGRMMYTNWIEKGTLYRFSAMALGTGRYQLMHELRFYLD